MSTMTAECPDPSDLRVGQLDELKFSQMKELAEFLIRCIEDGMKIVEILEKDTKVKTKMMRMSVTTYASLLKDLTVAYEKRVKEGN